MRFKRPSLLEAGRSVALSSMGRPQPQLLGAHSTQMATTHLSLLPARVMCACTSMPAGTRVGPGSSSRAFRGECF